MSSGEVPGRATPDAPTSDGDVESVRTGALVRRPPVVLTLGKFDGVHAGHRHLMALAIEEAGHRGVRSAALVLHPDPVAVLTAKPVGLLTTLRERCTRIRAFGVDLVEPLHFTPEVARLSPEVFMAQVSKRFDVVGMVVGPDFRFGHDRAGTMDTLSHLGKERGFEVIAAPPLEYEGRQIGSRHVRSLIEDGQIDSARTLLRAPPRLTGIVVHGSARGRKLGFPTANLDPTDDFVVPANGIYTVRASWRCGARKTGMGAAEGITSIGIRPTFDRGPRVIEVFLLDFTGDLYGCQLTLDFLARQRGERRFESVEALVAQMHADVTRGRALLAAEAAAPWELDKTATGVTLRAYGRDLAALCEHAASGLYEALGIEPPSAPTKGRYIHLVADGDRAVLAEWLGNACAPMAEDYGSFARASVFQAGGGALHALLTGGTGPTARPPVKSIHLGAIERGADGRLQVLLACET